MEPTQSDLRGMRGTFMLGCMFAWLAICNSWNTVSASEALQCMMAACSALLLLTLCTLHVHGSLGELQLKLVRVATLAGGHNHAKASLQA